VNHSRLPPGRAPRKDGWGMNEQDRPRPVSGEIMAGEAARPATAREPSGFTDAEYETVERALPAAPAPLQDEKPAAGMDFLRAGAKAIDDGSRRGGPLFWTFGLVLVVLAFWVSGGHALMRQHMPALPLAGPEEPLQIGEVASRVERHNGRAVLFVDGRAENRGGEALALPSIEIAVTANDGATTRYFLGTRGAELAPGDRYSFSSRLEAPTNGVKTVSVSFQEDER